MGPLLAERPHFANTNSAPELSSRQLPLHLAAVPVVDAMGDQSIRVDAEAEHPTHGHGHAPGGHHQERQPVCGCGSFTLDDQLLDVVVQLIEVGEKPGQGSSVLGTSEPAVAHCRGVLVDEVLCHAGGDAIRIMRVQRIKVGEYGGTGRPDGQDSPPQMRRTLLNTCWSCEISMTLPSGSLKEQT
jgi:hypothetical protein